MSDERIITNEMRHYSKKKIKSKLEFKKKVKLKNNKSLQTVKIMDGKGVI